MTVNAVYSFNTVFENPFKENLSLTHRVAIIAFHVFTLGIPLAIYSAIDCCERRILSGLYPNYSEIEPPRDTTSWISKSIFPT